MNRVPLVIRPQQCCLKEMQLNTISIPLLNDDVDFFSEQNIPLKESAFDILDNNFVEK